MWVKKNTPKYKQRKVGDPSQEGREDSVFNSYYTEV